MLPQAFFLLPPPGLWPADRLPAIPLKQASLHSWLPKHGPQARTLAVAVVQRNTFFLSQKVGSWEEFNFSRCRPDLSGCPADRLPAIPMKQTRLHGWLPKRGPQARLR